nr:olfactory receptor 30 [Tropidothorax elegans]
MKPTNWPQFFLVRCYGHWPGEGITGMVQRTVSGLVVLLTVLLLVSEGLSTRLYFLNGDLEIGLVNLNEMLFGIQCLIFLLTFLAYKPEISEAINLLDGLTEQVVEEMAGDLEVERELKKRKWRCLWAHRFFFWSFVLVCHWALRPLLHFCLYGEPASIVHCLLPFDNHVASGFFYNYFFQLIPCTSFCVCFCMFGSLFVSICEQILGHMEILKHRLETLEYGKEDTYRDLVKSVKHHKEILRIVQISQQFSSVPLIAMCLFTVLVLCVILFEITSVESATNERIINLLEEAQQEIFFLATYCWYGNEITSQGVDLLRPGYMSHWYDGTTKEKRILLTLMTRTIVPSHFGGFIRIDLLTFINVIKAAFSYYNFLNAVNSDVK